MINLVIERVVDKLLLPDDLCLLTMGPGYLTIISTLRPHGCYCPYCQTLIKSVNLKMELSRAKKRYEREHEDDFKEWLYMLAVAEELGKTMQRKKELSREYWEWKNIGCKNHDHKLEKCDPYQVRYPYDALNIYAKGILHNLPIEAITAMLKIYKQNGESYVRSKFGPLASPFYRQAVLESLKNYSHSH